MGFRKTKSNRPRLAPVSEQMKAWSAALEAEVLGWPGVTSRPMFGLRALYRGARIFAALPRTRAMGTPNSVAFKVGMPGPRLAAKSSKKVSTKTKATPKRSWLTYELKSDKDMGAALQLLSRAYEAAR